MNMFQKSLLIGAAVISLGTAALPAQAGNAKNATGAFTRNVAGERRPHGDLKFGECFKDFRAKCFATLNKDLKLNTNREADWTVHALDQPAEPGAHALAITVNGLQRNYIVHVPQSYRPQTPTPLVIMLHGGGGTATAAMWETGWATKADEEGFLAVFPNAMARDPTQPSDFSINPQLWNDGSDRFYPGQQAPDDVRFIAAMLDDLSARFLVDKQRIFVAGFSNGASMSFRVGAELSDRIAAIAPVAGALWFDPPALMHPVSMLYITGTADPLNLIEGGVPKLANGASESVRAKPKPPVRDSISKWAAVLACQATKASISEVHGVRTETNSSCAGDAEVVYIAVEDLGHTWAGGRSILPESMVGKTSDKISATNVIWAFFQKHALTLPPSMTEGAVVEYANTVDFPLAPGGHFFYSSDTAEQQFIDGGGAGHFQRTGRGFKAGGYVPVCRFYGSTTPGPNSHFFSVDQDECNGLTALQKSPIPTDFPQWNSEGKGFYAAATVTDVNGNRTCLTGTVPVYRAYNNAYKNGVRNAWDSNHRFSTTQADIDQLVNNYGWIDEGIVFCVPN